MDDGRFQLDPEAKFDDEIARIARENNADVAFRLVQRREDRAMPHPCATCATPTPATHVMTINKPGHEPVRAYVCEADAKWIAKGRADSELIPPSKMDPKRVEQLKPLMADKTVTIRGSRMPEPPERNLAHGGPGGRSMAPDLPPPPPAPRPDRGSGPTWDRLVCTDRLPFVYLAERKTSQTTGGIRSPYRRQRTKRRRLARRCSGILRCAVANLISDPMGRRLGWGPGVCDRAPPARSRGLGAWNCRRLCWRSTLQCCGLD